MPLRRPATRLPARKVVNRLLEITSTMKSPGKIILAEPGAASLLLSTRTAD
jgi:hypothetical protein